MYVYKNIVQTLKIKINKTRNVVPSNVIIIYYAIIIISNSYNMHSIIQTIRTDFDDLLIYDFRTF